MDEFLSLSSLIDLFPQSMEGIDCVMVEFVWGIFLDFFLYLSLLSFLVQFAPQILTYMNLFGIVYSLKSPISSKVNTCDVIQTKRSFVYISPCQCLLCKEVDESIGHFFLHCKFASHIWLGIFGWFGISGMLPAGCSEFLLIKWADIGIKWRSRTLKVCCYGSYLGQLD